MGRQHDDSLFGGGRHGIFPVVIFLQMLIAFRIRNSGSDVRLQELIVRRMGKNQILFYLLEQFLHDRRLLIKHPFLAA